MSKPSNEGSKDQAQAQTGAGHDAAKWKSLWATTPWHRDYVDPYLQKYLGLLKGDNEHISIFVSWCGKSLDLLWLAQQGHKVVGVELSEFGVNQFFQENNLAFSTSDINDFKLFTAKGLDLSIYSGDMHNFAPTIAGCTFDAVWDHHALGANGPSNRSKHIEVLLSILKPTGRILLSNLEYNTSEHPGPPYSLPTTLVEGLFGDHFKVEFLESMDMTNDFIARKFKLTWARRPIHFLQRTN